MAQVNSSPGVPVTVATVAANQLTTQSNPFEGNTAIVFGTAAVAGPNYASPGQLNIGNPAGGGP